MPASAAPIVEYWMFTGVTLIMGYWIPTGVTIFEDIECFKDLGRKDIGCCTA
jgi:hypothetical protein